MTPAEQQRKLRKYRKENGLCTYCGNKSRSAKTNCESCKNKRSESVKKYRHNNKINFNKSVSNRYELKKTNNSCTRCSSPPESGKSLCLKCRSQVTSIQKKNYIKNVDNNVCVNCRKVSEIGVICDSCKSKRYVYYSDTNVQEHQRFYRENNWQKILFSTLKARAVKKNIYVCPDLSLEDIPNPSGKSCPIFGSKFTIGYGSKSDFSATVDRIDPSIGYIKNNIQLISSLANTIKNNASYEDIMNVGLAVTFMEKNPTITNDYDESTRVQRTKMLSRKKATSRKREFSIQWYNISLPSVCPCLGIKLDYMKTDNDWRNRPSIDRIDNSKGYIPGNVWVISSWANAIKSSANGHKIIQVANWLKQNQPL